MAEISKVPVEDEIQSSYIDYAMSVIIGRAIPDVRDGLKPVQRRILYAMYRIGNTHDKPTKKSARITGEVIGKYHPHGDIPVYDAIVRLAQPFAMNYVLIEGQGNFGSIDGDAPAAMRYTEVRLTKLAEEMLEDLDSETVPFMPNFDNTEQEPVVLPAKVPNLLINGASGIAVGVATSIPPHNLEEVCNAIVYLLDHKTATPDELLEIIKGPDFPTGGIAIMSEGAKNGYRFGRGQITVRAKAEILDKENKIVVKELPYGVNKAQLIKHIVELVKEKVITGIRDLHDESDKEGISIVIYLASDANAEQVLNSLYRHTQLQITFPIINLAVKGNSLMTYNIVQLLNAFINHRKEVITKRSQHELNLARERLHIVDGLIVAINNIDKVIEIIKGSAETGEARAKLQEGLSLSEKQANAILDMKLGRLTKLESSTLEKEKEELNKSISYYSTLLASELEIEKVIKQETIEIKEKYKRPRRTELVFSEEPVEVKDEDLISNEQVAVLFTASGYIKRISLSEYKEQERGGKGVITMGLKEGDFVKRVVVLNNKEYLLFVTNKGRVYWLKAYNVPEGNRYSEGRSIANLLNLKEETVVDLFSVSDFEHANIVFLTRNGIIKKTKAVLFSRPRSNGIKAITLRQDDTIADVLEYKDKPYLMLLTKKGKAIKFKEEKARPMGRSASGVRGVRLANGDTALNVLAVEDDGAVITISEKGYGKMTSVKDYRLQGRGGYGIRNFKVNEKTGDVAKGLFVKDEQKLLIVNSKGISITVPVHSIRHTGRSASGVKLMRLDQGASIIDAKLI